MTFVCEACGQETAADAIDAGYVVTRPKFGHEAETGGELMCPCGAGLFTVRVEDGEEGDAIVRA